MGILEGLPAWQTKRILELGTDPRLIESKYGEATEFGHYFVIYLKRCYGPDIRYAKVATKDKAKKIVDHLVDYMNCDIVKIKQIIDDDMIITIKEPGGKIT